MEEFGIDRQSNLSAYSLVDSGFMRFALRCRRYKHLFIDSICNQVAIIYMVACIYEVATALATEADTCRTINRTYL